MVRISQFGLTCLMLVEPVNCEIVGAYENVWQDLRPCMNSWKHSAQKCNNLKFSLNQHSILT